MVCTPRSPMTIFLKTEIPYNPYLSRLKLEFRALTMVSIIYKPLMAMNKFSAWRDQIVRLSGLQTVSFTPLSIMSPITYSYVPCTWYVLRELSSHTAIKQHAEVHAAMRTGQCWASSRKEWIWEKLLTLIELTLLLR